VAPVTTVTHTLAKQVSRRDEQQYLCDGASSLTAVLLLAMNAQLEVTSKRGKRTVAMSEFYVPPEKSLINETVVQPDEIITAVFVPIPDSGTRSAYQKYGEKESFDWPLADAGVVLEHFL
jgi:xanthine dehydrogenase YagS FAD-binding subunit